MGRSRGERSLDRLIGMKTWNIDQRRKMPGVGSILAGRIFIYKNPLKHLKLSISQRVDIYKGINTRLLHGSPVARSRGERSFEKRIDEKTWNME